MQEEQRIYNEPRNCGCNSGCGGGLGSLFGGCGCGRK